MGNTGVMQRHTQPQKSRATHPRALRPLSWPPSPPPRFLPLALAAYRLSSPSAPTSTTVSVHSRARRLCACNLRYRLAKWLPRRRITVHVKRCTDKKATAALGWIRASQPASQPVGRSVGRLASRQADWLDGRSRRGVVSSQIIGAATTERTIWPTISL